MELTINGDPKSGIVIEHRCTSRILTLQPAENCSRIFIAVQENSSDFGICIQRVALISNRAVKNSVECYLSDLQEGELPIYQKTCKLIEEQ